MQNRRGVIVIQTLIGLIVVAVVLPLLGNLIKKPQDTRNLAVAPSAVISECCSNNNGCQAFKCNSEGKPVDGSGVLIPPGGKPEYVDSCACGPKYGAGGGNDKYCEESCLGYGTCKAVGNKCCTDDISKEAYCENGLFCDTIAGRTTFGTCVVDRPICPAGESCGVPVPGDPADCGKYDKACCTKKTPCESGYKCGTDKICHTVHYECNKSDTTSSCGPIIDLDNKNPAKCDGAESRCWGYGSTCEFNCKCNTIDATCCLAGDMKTSFCQNGLDCVSGKCKEKKGPEESYWYFCGLEGKCVEKMTKYENAAQCRENNSGRTCYQGTAGKATCEDVCSVAKEYYGCKTNSDKTKTCESQKKWGSLDDCNNQLPKATVTECTSKEDCASTCCGNKDGDACCSGTGTTPCKTGLTCNKDKICKTTEIPKTPCTDAVSGIKNVGIGDTGCNTKNSFAVCKGDDTWGTATDCKNGCKDGACVECGEKNQDCCTGDKCDDGLECSVDKKCIVKTIKPSDCKINKGLTYTGPNAIGGDYNCNGVVDLGDYSVWRKEKVDKLRWIGTTSWWADGNTPFGVVDGADYSLWRHKFLD